MKINQIVKDNNHVKINQKKETIQIASRFQLWWKKNKKKQNRKRRKNYQENKETISEKRKEKYRKLDLDIINKKINSYYRDFALEICQKIGSKKAGTPMAIMGRFEILRVSFNSNF